MKKVVVALAAVALVTGPAMAQQGQGTESRTEASRADSRAWSARGGMAGSPIARLLERREALELTAEQVARLEAIEARVERENAPRIERLRAVLGDRSVRELSDDERAQLRDRMQELRPVREEIRETNRAALAEARECSSAARLWASARTGWRVLRRTSRRRVSGSWRPAGPPEAAPSRPPALRPGR